MALAHERSWLYSFQRGDPEGGVIGDLSVRRYATAHERCPMGRKVVARWSALWRVHFTELGAAVEACAPIATSDTGVPARSRTAAPTRGQPANPRRLPARRPPRRALPHMSTHAPGSARRMAHVICGCSSRRHDALRRAMAHQDFAGSHFAGHEHRLLAVLAALRPSFQPGKETDASMAVSKPLCVPRYCTPNYAHLTFTLRLLIIPFSRKLRIEPA